ncbi:hypothetical protein T265_14300, partial [Opisthorchis viverrini]
MIQVENNQVLLFKINRLPQTSKILGAELHYLHSSCQEIQCNHSDKKGRRSPRYLHFCFHQSVANQPLQLIGSRRIFTRPNRWMVIELNNSVILSSEAQIKFSVTLSPPSKCRMQPVSRQCTQSSFFRQNGAFMVIYLREEHHSIRTLSPPRNAVFNLGSDITGSVHLTTIVPNLNKSNEQVAKRRELQKNSEPVYQQPGNSHALFQRIRANGQKRADINETICEEDGTVIHFVNCRLERPAEPIQDNRWKDQAELNETSTLTRHQKRKTSMIYQPYTTISAQEGYAKSIMLSAQYPSHLRCSSALFCSVPPLQTSDVRRLSESEDYFLFCRSSETVATEGVRSKFISLMRVLYVNHCGRVRVYGKFSPEFTTSSSVRQCCPPSPSPVKFFIDLLHEIPLHCEEGLQNWVGSDPNLMLAEEPIELLEMGLSLESRGPVQPLLISDTYCAHVTSVFCQGGAIHTASWVRNLASMFREHTLSVSVFKALVESGGKIGLVMLRYAR